MKTAILKFIFVFTLVPFLSIIYSTRSFATSDEFLIKKCQEMEGTIVRNWTCPRSGDHRNELHCQILDEEGRSMYFNGCSGSVGNYGEIFFQACVYHDLCYHHEPATHGYKRYDCDSQFYHNMIKICDSRPKDSRCKGRARLFFDAVSTFGKNAWICSSDQASYPRRIEWLLKPLLNLVVSAQ